MENFAKQLTIKPEGLGQIFDFLPYPLLLARREEGVLRNIFANTRFRDEIGYAIEEIPSITDWFEVAYPDVHYRTEIRQEWEKRVSERAGDATVTLPAIIKTKNFGYQWYEVTSNISGEIHVVAFVNIQSVKMHERELQEENRNRDRILSILGHDLRGPIGNLVTLTGLFKEGHLSPDEFQHAMSAMQSDAAHSAELLDTLLTWTRSNFNKVNVRSQLIDFTKMINTTLALYEYAIKAKELSIQFFQQVDQPFYSDEVILSIAIRNIVSNAIKFSPAKGTITMTADTKGDKIYLSVKDSGVGMSREYIDFITNNLPFSREGTHREKGFGLGLRLCREFLPLIGGSLEIASEENKGTTVMISFPMGKALQGQA